MGGGCGHDPSLMVLRNGKSLPGFTIYQLTPQSFLSTLPYVALTGTNSDAVNIADSGGGLSSVMPMGSCLANGDDCVTAPWS